VFCHESGIHCAGILKDPTSYQPFSPEILGRDKAQLVAGRHSGAAVLQHLLAEAGAFLPGEQTGQLLRAVRAEALSKQAALSAHDLLRLYHRTFSCPDRCNCGERGLVREKGLMAFGSTAACD
jgi:homocitrate synthase NifV